MPSIFKKIFHSSYAGGKRNPYRDPKHVLNKSAPSLPTTPATKPTPAPGRPASPRGSHDYLAEARAVVGRDPVTGKRLRDRSQMGSRGGVDVSGYGGDGAGAGTANGEGAGGSGRRAGEGGEKSGVGERNEGAQKAMGMRYDLLVQEMLESKRKREAWKDPEQGYYAPERRVGEFYAPLGR
ncbi:hypothetical protein BU26DRAFT_518981 [Trematosphaeria pertusa]|uniref:Uncharacterized protein n=1 Tax=Trematosphaeria pertusa TaxID=390896 RepID=A0A6A6IEB3_9PLEO|nr:uncharacterized protein BU26DRAFT_518981 [Trematosphaeria pertusa]KAF2248766.1 hypothetical protein BU26DRAFT_518981 [Trematosphaeria pertusa]